MMLNGQFATKLQIMRQRTQSLYRRASDTTEPNVLLAEAFEELETAMEELRAAEDELHQQHEEWLNSRGTLELERKRYEELFTQAPAGYLVTSLEGTIRQANPAAAKLLQTNERLLIGRSLSLFVPEGQRRPFRAQITELRETDEPQEWELLIEPWQGTPFHVGVIVRLVRGLMGHPVALHWLMWDISAQKQAQAALEARLAELEQRVANQPAPPESEWTATASQDVSNQESGDRVRRQFAFLAEASVLLMLTHDLETTLAHLARLAISTIADCCIIDLAEPQEGTMYQLVIARDLDEGSQIREFRRRYIPRAPERRRAQQPVGQTQGGLMRELPEPTLGSLEQDADLRLILGALSPTSAIVMPLQIHGQAIGSLTFGSGMSGYRYGPAEVALVEELARRISAALDREQSYRVNEVGAS